MSAPINFISPTQNVRLSKTITDTGVIPYPRTKKLSSISHHVECSLGGLTELHKLLVDNAKAGNALLKGPIKEPIVNESRAGKTDTRASTPLLVLDIDGWVPENKLEAPIKQTDLIRVAESVINLLPEPLCSTSYIVNASSSTGTKPSGEIGLHFFFLMDTSLYPSNLEAYFKSLNFSNDTIRDKLSLQASHMSLKWIVDPVVARNAQIIYIANPEFTNREDPFTTPEDRWALQTKDRHTCDLYQQVMTVNQADVDGKATKLLNKLRNERGLGKFKPRTRTMTVMGERQRVLTNPDKLEMERNPVKDSDRFVYWNINGGDSNAYYNPIANPEVIYNFKGEPPFLLKVARDREHERAGRSRSFLEGHPLLFRPPSCLGRLPGLRIIGMVKTDKSDEAVHLFRHEPGFGRNPRGGVDRACFADEARQGKTRDHDGGAIWSADRPIAYHGLRLERCATNCPRRTDGRPRRASNPEI